MLVSNMHLHALYLSVKVSSAEVLIGDTILSLLIETGPLFVVAIRATQRSSRALPHFRPWVMMRYRELNLQPPALPAAVKRSTDWANPNIIHLMSGPEGNS